MAAEDGRAVSEVVSERWGSLSTLTATLTAGRAAHGDPHSGVTAEPVRIEPWAVRDCKRADTCWRPPLQMRHCRARVSPNMGRLRLTPVSS